METLGTTALKDPSGNDRVRELAPAEELGERAARHSLREQIGRLERELAEAFVTAYRLGGLDGAATATAQPRLLGLGELERVRDQLAERLRAARITISERAEIQDANRVLLERMLLEPHKYRFARVAARDVGQPGCGVWHVRPRLGLLGMLMGWWEVKLSSGCPLARGRGGAPAARAREEIGGVGGPPRKGNRALGPVLCSHACARY